jgi:hypothetical protein
LASEIPLDRFLDATREIFELDRRRRLSAAALTLIARSRRGLPSRMDRVAFAAPAPISRGNFCDATMAA